MANYDVTLQGGSPWGIRLQGGVDYNIPIKIAQVTSGSKSESRGVLAGSFLLEINGNKTDHLTMSQAQTLIKMTGTELQLLMNHPDKASPQCERFIVVDGGKPWGFRFQGGVNHGTPLLAAQISRGSKVDKHGLKNGDHISSINGNSTEKLTMEQAQNLVKQTGQQLTLGIKHVEADGSLLTREDSQEPKDEKKKKVLNELKDTIETRDANWGKHHEAKGNTFISLQEHTEAGLGKQVRTVFDVAASDRNKSIPIMAPRVSESSKDPGHTREITLVGGKPWGIRLQGGIVAGTPLQIAIVSPGSKAELAGLVNGDVLESINDIKTTILSMLDAQNVIKDTGVKLKLCVTSQKPLVVETSKEDEDEAFYEDLKMTMQGCSDGDGDRHTDRQNSHTFKKLQSIVDSNTAK